MFTVCSQGDPFGGSNRIIEGYISVRSTNSAAKKKSIQIPHYHNKRNYSQYFIGKPFVYSMYPLPTGFPDKNKIALAAALLASSRTG